MAESSVEGGACCLRLLAAGGARCSGALVFLALAEFDLLDAAEDRSAAGPQRVFRLPAWRERSDSGR